MQVNQSVLVMDEKSEHAGRAGVVQAVKKGVISVALDANSEQESTVADFREAQLRPL